MQRLLLMAGVGLVLVAAIFAIRWWTKPEMKLVILMGQANIAGRGDPKELPIGFPLHPDQIREFREGFWQIPNLVQRKIGPGVALADTLISMKAADRVGLVLCYRGSTVITEWIPGTPRYKACIDATRKASERGKLFGVAFYQGESDTDTMDHVKAWPAHFAEIASALRRDLNNPSLPIAMVAIGRWERPPDEAHRYWSEMQAEQRAIQLPNVSIVDASKFPVAKDGGHLSAVSQLALGLELAVKLAQSRP